MVITELLDIQKLKNFLPTLAIKCVCRCSMLLNCLSIYCRPGQCLEWTERLIQPSTNNSNSYRCIGKKSLGIASSKLVGASWSAYLGIRHSSHVPISLCIKRLLAWFARNTHTHILWLLLLLLLLLLLPRSFMLSSLQTLKIHMCICHEHTIRGSHWEIHCGASLVPRND